jgi:hypothetical protein
MLLVAVLMASGCGGGGPSQKTLAGTGYTFSAPSSWSVARTQRQVQASAGKESLELVAVTRFRLLRAFRAELWPKVIGELDRTAKGIAEQQNGSVTETKTVTISGRRARWYTVAYDLRGKKLVERLVFVLRAKTEYFLLCRYEQGNGSKGCELLLRTFRLV